MIRLAALDALPVPLFTATRNGHITWANPAWLETLGIAVGSAWHPPFHEIDRQRADSLWVDCVERKTPTRLSSPVTLANGETSFCEVLLQPASTDHAEELSGLLIDVTDQVIAAAEIHAILDTAVDGIVIIDEAGIIQTFNQAAASMFGYEPEEVIGRSVNMLMPPETAAQHDGYVRHYLTTGATAIIGVGRELEAQAADGTRFPVYLAVSDIVLDGRHRFAGIIRNLTEQQAAREALASQREKLAHVGRLSTMGEMTASIAHEINQPLTAISMYAQASLKLMERPDGTARIRDALEKLNTQALRAGAVIERIQRFAKAQETSKELIEINDLLVDLLKLAGSDARLHDIRLRLELANDLPPVFADPVQIQQVVLNLIRNGIDAMLEIGCRHGRTIMIASRQTPHGELEVEVRDQGAGVAEQQVDLLFTPFHTTKKEGMGMGLSICRSIIAEHGGVLRYRNNDGPGACFYFRLPMSHDSNE